MEDVYYNACVQIRLVLDGGIHLFENEGNEIIAKLQKQGAPELITALDSMGEALYWARSKAHDALIQAAERTDAS